MPEQNISQNSGQLAVENRGRQNVLCAKRIHDSQRDVRVEGLLEDRIEHVDFETQQGKSP